jgi:hypothetical protein
MRDLQYGRTKEKVSISALLTSAVLLPITSNGNRAQAFVKSLESGKGILLGRNVLALQNSWMPASAICFGASEIYRAFL